MIRMTHRFVIAISLFVHEAEVRKIVLGKFDTIVIRICQVLVGIAKHQDHCNTSGSNDIAPRVGNTLNRLKPITMSFIPEESRQHTFLKIAEDVVISHSQLFVASHIVCITRTDCLAGTSQGSASWPTKAIYVVTNVRRNHRASTQSGSSSFRLLLDFVSAAFEVTSTTSC